MTASEERQKLIELLQEAIRHMDILNQQIRTLYQMDEEN